MKLDTFSESLDSILQEYFTAFVMKDINSTIGFEDSKKSLMDTIRFYYGAMFLGQDKHERLYPNYLFWYDENKTLIWWDLPDWMGSFFYPLETASGRESWELILNCTQSSAKQELQTSGRDSKKCKNKNKKFNCCFELHSTEEVKASFEGVGEYHKFILGKAFNEQSDEVNIIFIQHSRKQILRINLSHENRFSLRATAWVMKQMSTCVTMIMSGCSIVCSHTILQICMISAPNT